MQCSDARDLSAPLTCVDNAASPRWRWDRSLYLLSPRPRRPASSAFGAAGASRVIEEFKPTSAKERLAAAVDELERARESGRNRTHCHDGDLLCRRRRDRVEDGLRAPFSFNQPRLFCAARGFTADGWSDDRKAFRGNWISLMQSFGD